MHAAKNKGIDTSEPGTPKNTTPTDSSSTVDDSLQAVAKSFRDRRQSQIGATK